MKRKMKGTLIKVGIFFGAGYFIIILLVLMLCCVGGGGSAGGLPIVATEEQAYEYQYICAEVGVPWDLALLSDIMLADQEGKSTIKDRNPIFTSLQFCIVTEKRLIREMVKTDQKTPEGEDLYEPKWHEAEVTEYCGLLEIIEYLDVEDFWLADKDMSEVIERLNEVCEDKTEAEETDAVTYTVSISVNSDTEKVLKEYIGLTKQRCEDALSLHNVQYMAQLYGYMYKVEEVELPELVVGEVTRNDLARVAVSLIGHPYLLGGKSPEQGSPSGPLDCSGFVDWVYIQCFGTGVSGGGVPEGVAVSGTAMQWYASVPIEESELKVGDLAFMYDPARLASGKVNHVGIYIGSVDGTAYFIHCGGRSYGTEELPSGRVGISQKSGTNNYNCVTGGSFEPAMKACKFRYFRRPNFSFVGD